MPWFEARFIPREFAPLFERELALVEGLDPLDVPEWERDMQEIWSRGAVLVLPSGERFDEYMLHVYSDGTARFRY
jgi:hypothetical protein